MTLAASKVTRSLRVDAHWGPIMAQASISFLLLLMARVTYAAGKLMKDQVELRRGERKGQTLT